MTSVKLGEGGGISIIDFGPFLDGSKKQEVGDAMLESFKKIGFVYLKNHGLPQDIIDNMFNWVRHICIGGYLLQKANGVSRAVVEEVLRTAYGNEDAGTASS